MVLNVRLLRQRDLPGWAFPQGFNPLAAQEGVEKQAQEGVEQQAQEGVDGCDHCCSPSGGPAKRRRRECGSPESYTRPHA
jgi:hypothetical protein